MITLLKVAAYMPALNSHYGTESEIRMPQTMSGTYRKWIAMAIGNRMKLMPFIRGQFN